MTFSSNRLLSNLGSRRCAKSIMDLKLPCLSRSAVTELQKLAVTFFIAPMAKIIDFLTS